MAVYRCEVKTLKRAEGRSAVAAAAYRAADRLTNAQDARRHDYRRRGPGVVASEILTPQDAPEWARQRGRLWNEAEAAEKRKNSVTAREVLISLPHELDDAQRVELVRGFASRLVERYGVAVDLSIHRPDRKGDQRNHHAHLMMTTRRMTREGLTEKTRELDDVKKRGPEEIEAIRELWENEQNNALSRANAGERVTRKSLAEQGIAREPQPKIGEAANALMKRGEKTRIGECWREVADRNAMQENAARVRAMRAQEEAQHRPSMRENMARQRTEKIERQKQDDIARALHAAQQAEAAQKVAPAKPDPSNLEAVRAWEEMRNQELREQRRKREAEQAQTLDQGRTRERGPPREAARSRPRARRYAPDG